ncbi:MAG: T9SS type A sorting domain-containing protein [Flavobacteriales bacterium]|nr:T9SS type A sorting domain-containing protein [Flavobacteriales bacterium]
MLQVFAQQPFERFYLANGSPQFNLIELASGNLFIGLGGPAVVNPNGNILHSSYNTGSGILSMAAVQRHSDNEYFFVAGRLLNGHIYPLIGRMDSLGNGSAIRQYELNGPDGPYFPSDLEILDNKSIIAWGGPGKFFALKVDSTGTPVWSKNFNHRGGVQFIRELPGGDVLAGFNMDTTGAVVARMNSNGDFVWCKSYIRPRGLVTDCLIESDDSFIITGFTDSIASTDIFTPLPPDYQPKLFMMKLDGTGEVQWCKGYGNAYTWYSRDGAHIVQAQDGNYVVLADLGYADYNRWYRPFLMKTDGNGDTLWTRSMGRANYQYEVNTLVAHSNGGYLYSGVIWGDLPDGHANASYLFKTDTLGHLPCWEQSHPGEVLDLFPVDSSFAMSWIEGATVGSVLGQNVINGALPTYDGCTFITGMTPTIQKGQKFKVLPNSNTGRFVMTFQDPLVADSYYSVYDAMGKLLLQRAAAHGKKTEEVDLSRYGAGTYVIKFTDPEGTCYERVVVE